MRALEAEAARRGVPATALMEHAGRAIAEALREELRGVRARRIVVLVGPGNNGGDGLVAARHLYELGAEVTVVLMASRPQDDANLTAVRGLDLTLIDLAAGESSGLDEALSRAEAVIDAVLGTGASRPLESRVALVFDRLRELHAPVFAVDLPSGVDGASGAADPHAVVADVTFALGFSKFGLHTLPGSQHAGRVHVLDIGLPGGLDAGLRSELLTPDWARDHLPDRPVSANKGSFGRVLVVAGSLEYTGAATLAALGALRAGAGLVTVAAIPEVRAAVASRLVEATYLVLPEHDGAIDATAASKIVAALPRYDALLIGPGLGRSKGAEAVVRGVLTAPEALRLPVVIDADGLNALAVWRSWWTEVKAKAVLTPHPGEMARLARTEVAAVQKDRRASATAQAEAWGQVVVLKGAHTLVVSPDGETLVSPVATAALATAGTGDVLAGTLAGLLAQGVAPFEAAGLAVYLHGAAAGVLSEAIGESGLLAGDLAAAIAGIAAELRKGAG
jgi:NAD(P)H-hydrate epimerase